MRFFAALLIGLLILSAASAQTFKTAQVCVRREENNGAMNIFSSRLVLRRESRQAFEKELSLIGGERKCVDVAPGRWVIEARSGRPYDTSARNENECRSNAIRLDVRGGHAFELEVEPRSHESTYICGWKLRFMSR